MRRVAIVAIAASAVCWGCAASRQGTDRAPQEKGGGGREPVSEAEALKIADKAAAGLLAEHNESEDMRSLYGGPLGLEDYERTAEEDSFEGSRLLSVLYKLKKGPPVLGGWSHFGIWVYLDTGETRVLRGR